MKIKMKELKKGRSETGITLVALVVTIVVLLILAGITIGYVFGENSIFNKANEAKFKAKWSTYREQTDTYTTWKVASTMDTNVNGINAGDTLIELIEIEADVDIEVSDVNIQISEIINNLEEQDKRYAVVYHGELCYVKDDRNPNAEKEAKWCLQIGIPVLELKRPSGVNNKNGDYEYVNGVYLNTPKLDMGFNKNYTRYAYENENGVMEPGNWIFSTAEEDWYDYNNGKWANVVTENKGIECYYTWIPRYCFKLNQSTQRADVKLIDINNNYKNPQTEEVTSWSELEKQGYQVPEAFEFGEEGKKTQLAGYWAMKYNLGEITDTAPSTIYYDMKVTQGVITISNIQVTNGNDIVKYVVNLNSEKQEEVTSVAGKTFKLDNMRSGDNVINITGLNAKGEMVGSYTRVYASSIVNPPDTTGFNKDTTFYVLYDENGNEYSTVPVSEPAPKGWYNYDEAEWANIVTRNNGGETYFTWIPRYEFVLEQKEQRSDVKFIVGTEGGTGANRAGVTAGYQVPEAFKFNDQEITGYWAMKYNLGEVNTAVFDAEVVASSNSSITVQGVTGTGTSTSGLKYNYYINDKPRNKDTKPYKTTTTAAEKVTFEGLTTDVEYTILIEIRNSSNGYVGSVVKQLEISQPNKPDLTGFNPECTYYVTYNGETEVIGEKITNDGSNMPEGWYDYSTGRWANIVTQNNGTKTYFTWIPRYEFKLNQQTQRSDVKFVKGTSGGTGANRAGVTPGYQVPEAFKFNEQEITGYWAMKYNLGE